MWTDNTTDKDFLGFDIHTRLIKELIKDDKMLPLTIGLFGDWGSGKSSILEALKIEIEREPNTACLYFNGWVFEGYDDAKAALIESILKEFENEEKFGEGIKDNINKLFKSVNWMRAIGFGIKNIALPAAAAYATGGLSLVPQLLEGLKDATKEPSELISKIQNSNIEDFIKQFTKESKDENNFDLVRKFRDEFEVLLQKSKINKLVVLIDDLDRCLPDRIIDNLEAIKLFLNVKNTAFVIGADPRIVRNAIEYRYKDDVYDRNQDYANNRIVYDYLEKLIQIPYNLPKLSDSEVETYITLLFSENDIEDPMDFEKVLNAFKEFREKDRYSVFSFVKIKEALGDEKKTNKLEQNISLIAKLSPIISESLYGNPRQIKRFLNTFLLRKKIAEIARITKFEDDILAKLMILEYAEPILFNELYNWQISNHGFAKEIKELEELVDNNRNGEAEIPSQYKGWNKPKILNWLSCTPMLGTKDLRDYYWISRDRLVSMQSNLLLSPIVKSIMLKLEPEGMAEKLTKKILEEEVRNLPSNDQLALFNSLKQRIITNDSNKRSYEVFNLAIEIGFEYKQYYIEALDSIGKKRPPFVIQLLKRIVENHSEFEKYIKKPKK